LSILGLFLWRWNLKKTLKNKNLCCLDICAGKISINKCASLV
jgi:hypothetical protein